jgi:hypothetical protein
MLSGSDFALEDDHLKIGGRIMLEVLVGYYSYNTYYIINNTII